MAPKNKEVEPVPLQKIEWSQENHKASVHTNQTSSQPPLWAHGAWDITRFEVLENGATLRLWWDSTPITRGG